jgi:hypothetical protein
MNRDHNREVVFRDDEYHAYFLQLLARNHRGWHGGSIIITPVYLSAH